MKRIGIVSSVVVCLLFSSCIMSGSRSSIVLNPLRTEVKRGPNLIPNASFEELTGDKPAGWKSQLSGDFKVDERVAHSGKTSLRFSKSSGDTSFWVSRTVMLNQTKPAPLVISGWSKAENVSGTMGRDYSIWVDAQYVDGTSLWGQITRFNVGTHDWQYSEFPFVVSKPVKLAGINILFRKGYTGTVWFDDISLQEMQVEGGAVFDRVAATIPEIPKEEIKTKHRLETGDGLVLGFGNDGSITEFTVNGKSMLGTAQGGFWLRDVACNGPWIRPACRVTRDGKVLKLKGADLSAGFQIEACLEPSAKGINVVTTVRDTTGRDRSVTAYFVLPVINSTWTWHDDIVRSTVTVPGSEYRNAQGWPATGLSSCYPFCSMTSGDVGLSLAAPMDCPRICRFVYNSSIHALYVAFDLGLSKETLKFPSSADFRFTLFSHTPEWGFRAATQKYYDIFPQFFQQRLKRGGIWMAFADISKVAGYEDFGFAYDELGGKFAKFDDENDIASFTYIEPMTYWLSMDKKYPRTYEGALQALADNEVSKKPELVKWAKTTRRCCAFTREGRFDLSVQNQSWCDGAVFTLNPDPGIPEDEACPRNKAHLGYSKEWADKNILQKEGGCVDGIYLDSMPNWGEVRNWRREHWRTTEVPLTFDPDTKQPVLMQIFSTWQFSKWVSDDVHGRGGVMHGNGGTCWPYFPALLDITGQETGSILRDSTMAQARTLLRNKPYSPLLNTRFDQMGAGLVEDYFNKSLLYCIFPSFFNGTYMKDDKWVTVHYFKEPRFYERDRPLFKKYIPILRRMFDAGWEPITLARTDPATVRVERYGPKNGDEVLFAVYNSASNSVNAKLIVDAEILKLNPKTKAAALVSGTTLTMRQDGSKKEIALSIPANKCEVVRLGL
ncbi:MAG: hypothetical protein PHR77_01430 [Kiritimatiellae bacterium]|nr:hypothetical protein [Kiritimatiellia bacterium]MDD5521737.1 hypothetical protein [Kiritimatiellia bacterium]